MLKCESELNLAFHALSDPGRRSMLDRLVRGEATLGQLAEPLDMSLPAVQQHLDILVRAGLVKTEKTGRVRACRLEAARLAEVEKWLADRRMQWNRKLDRLEAHLKEGDLE